MDADFFAENFQGFSSGAGLYYAAAIPGIWSTPRLAARNIIESQNGQLNYSLQLPKWRLKQGAAQSFLQFDKWLDKRKQPQDALGEA